jgi:hypothetical protein
VEVVVLAECYANKCIADEIVNLLRLRENTIHSRVMGRDKVLKKYRSTLERYANAYVIAVIDYEEGIMRTFIDRNFNLRTSLYNGKVHIGIDRMYRRGLAIVFDTCIEEFLCEITNKFCRDEDRKDVKHGDLDCGRIIDSKVIEVLKIITSHIHDIFSHS